MALQSTTSDIPITPADAHGSTLLPYEPKLEQVAGLPLGDSLDVIEPEKVLDEDDSPSPEKPLQPDDDSTIIRTGADAAAHLLSDRDDGDSALTIRSLVLGTIVAAFQAVMNQIYQFKPTSASISGAFLVLLIYFLGRGWALLLPRGDLLEQKHRERDSDAPLSFWTRFWKIVNPGEFGLKEHGLAVITASSASNATSSIQVFATQALFYPDNPLTARTAILGVLSIGLFGYGLTGIFRPVTIDSPEAVYWSNVPLINVIQGLHWETIRTHKMRLFWYAFAFMAVYELVPGYMFPWLNSVSIPCLAAMHATGNTGQILTRLFGGSLSNEGLGLFNFSFDWQYITSGLTSLPLTFQLNSAIGILICYVAMSAVYYGNAWGGLSQPFMSTLLRTADGGVYNTTQVFTAGRLDQGALEDYGLPHLAATYVWASIMGTAAIGALFGHCFFFWGPNILETLKTLRRGGAPDRHYEAMRKYTPTPWWWFTIVMVLSFVFGIVVCASNDITLPIWALVVALLVGTVIAPVSTILYSRFGDGIATNQLMKMIAGVVIPGRPLGNLYFTSWSHSVIAQSLNLASDLKLGVYLKIAPRTMFVTQVWGTVFGAFLNYAVMISVVTSRRELLLTPNGSYAWSGATFQSLNNQATTWALSKELYSAGDPYVLVPVGLAIGLGAVLLHRVVYQFLPRIKGFDIRDVNLPVLLEYAGWMGYNQTQTSTIASTICAGMFVQYYLRNYKPKIFKNYSYLIAAAFDGGSLLCIFILSFAVFGAAGSQHLFPNWWGNPADGYVDHCPAPED